VADLQTDNLFDFAGMDTNKTDAVPAMGVAPVEAAPAFDIFAQPSDPMSAAHT